MTAPKRIQMRRTKGWRKPDGTIVVARPSRWGNPFVVGAPVSVHGFDANGQVFEGSAHLSAEMAVELYAQEVQARITVGPQDEHPEDHAYVEEWRRALAELRGHDLACWCPPSMPCHADVLLDLANRASS